jgi:acetylornithine deacetylase/succinyl-diaminopimelate desuccinylase-like protein
MADALTNETVELLQALIRNRCVNDGTAESGQEVRNSDVLAAYLDGCGLDLQRYEPTPGRVSIVGRMHGSDPAAPSLCLMGHTDVVPVNPDGWCRDPFGGELVDGEVWGRGAVDMLNLTASMAVAVRHLVGTGFRPRGDLVYFAVADEESGSRHGAQWMADHEPEAITVDYVLTENGGLHSGPAEAPFVGVNVGEKGVAWRRLRVRGTPGHGSMPWRTDNALVKAAAVVQRLARYRPPARFHELWKTRVETLDVDEETRRLMLDPDSLDELLEEMPSAGVAGHLHACTHTTFSCNVLDGSMKTNVIPDAVAIDVDIRTLPGENSAAVEEHLRTALGDLADAVEVEILMNDQASISRTDSPLWDSLQRAVNRPFPTARLTPQLVVGFTDARVFRALGATAYGAGLFSPALDGGDFARRFHGNDERIDVESLELTTRLWIDVCRDLLG